MRNRLLIYFLLPVLTAVIYAGCKDDKMPVTHQKNTGWILKPIDTFHLNIPNEIPYPTQIYQTNSTNRGFSFTYNNDTSQIIIECDFKKNKWKTHIFDFDGPEGISNFSQYYIDDNGNVFLLPLGGINKVFIFNKKDKLKEVIPYKEYVIKANSTKYRCHYTGKMFYMPMVQYTDFKNYGDTKLIKSINTGTHKERNLVSVPDDFFKYHSDNIFDLSPEFVFPNDSIIVFIMRKSPYIHVYDKSSSTVKKYYFPNENISYTEHDIKMGHDNLDYKDIKGYYHSLLYDKKNKRYFRLSIFNAGNNRKNAKFDDRRVRIDVFDKKFNHLATGDYKNLFPAYSFIADGKLYINSKQTKENVKVFTVFALEKDNG